MERRLAAILAADVVGYSRLMGADEVGTLAALKSHREAMIDPKIAQYHGRIVKLMGDGLLVEFPSAVEAIQCAVQIQHMMAERNADVPEERRIIYRVGVNIGDIVVEDDDIFGDGVNIAARLEVLADPGGICISRPVHTQIKGKLDLTFEHLGEKEIKNIADPVTVYRVVIDDKATALTTPVIREGTKRIRQRWSLVASAVIALFFAVGGALWWQPWATKPAGLATSAPPQHTAASIAVLPFNNLSGGEELDYFSDGMTEDIITELSLYPSMRVISRTSSFAYKGKSLTAQQVGQELGVRYVLEGSVRKQGDRVRITAQLIDVATNAHVWANRFDEEGTDVFGLQDRIAARIDETLAGHGGSVNEAEYKRVWAMDASKLEEYDYYLRGHSVYFEFTPEALLKSREIFQEGLRKFPDSGLLRVKVGWTYFQFVYLGYSNDPQSDMELAEAFVRQAFADRHMPRVGQWYGHWLLAYVGTYYRHDHKQALAEAETMVRYAPNHSDTLADAAQIAVYAGAPDRAIEWLTRAISLQPKVPDYYYAHLGLAYFRKGDCPRAMEELEKLSWIYIGYSAPLISCYVKADRLDDAKSQLAKVLESMPGISLANVSMYLPFDDQTIVDNLLGSLRETGLSG